MQRKPPALGTIGTDINARSISRLRYDCEAQLLHGCFGEEYGLELPHVPRCGYRPLSFSDGRRY